MGEATSSFKDLKNIPISYHIYLSKYLVLTVLTNSEKNEAKK